MTEKRFKLHIVWVNYDKTDGSATLSDNGQPLLECECVEDMRRVKELLNELNDKNKQLKSELGKLNILYKAKCKTEEQLLEMGKEVEKENEQLKKENQRMTDKLNELALEFLNYDMVTMGKATEISEMCYYDFLKYRKDNGNPMELQL